MPRRLLIWQAPSPSITQEDKKNTKANPISTSLSDAAMMWFEMRIQRQRFFRCRARALNVHKTEKDIEKVGQAPIPLCA